MVSALIGNLITVLLVLGVVWISAREIYKSHKNGGCSGCGSSGGCSGCCGSCTKCSTLDRNKEKM